MGSVVGMYGLVFGKLTVVGAVPTRLGSLGKLAWECLCSCGNLKVVLGEALRSGNTSSCGCTHRQRGPDNRNYDHTKTEEDRVRRRFYPGYNEWRSRVFARDGWSCLACGSRKDIKAHHIMSYSAHRKYRLVDINGVTLCNICHRSFHKQHGIKNNNLAQFLEWSNEKGVTL